MSQRISVRIPNEVFQSLREEAIKHGVRISDVVRDKILKEKISKVGTSVQAEEIKFEAFTKPGGELNDKISPNIHHADFAALESLYLLREFLFERNAQILKRVDDKMEKRFGKERKRIL
jgi:heterodisulfide reductase subunit C